MPAFLTIYPSARSAGGPTPDPWNAQEEDLLLTSGLVDEVPGKYGGVFTVPAHAQDMPILQTADRFQNF